MGYFKNSDTNGMEFYHGSKTGIKGQIAPNKSAGAADFGEGFYLGTREMQTLSRVSNEPNPFEYKFNIPDTCINKNNRLFGHPCGQEMPISPVTKPVPLA